MAKKKKKATKKRKPMKTTRKKMTRAEEHDLAESLARYINPDHEEFDLDFTIEMMRIRPDWFSDAERERVANWAKARTRKK